MSLESAKAFLAKMKSDSDFAKKVNGAQSQAELENMVKDAGFTFTKAELNKCREGEISDADLEKVAGGCNIVLACIIN